MPKAKAPRPTGAELEILNVLWRRGPATVREVQEELRKSKPAMGYTTVLKLMQIMAGKNLVRRDERQRAHVYEARLAEEQTQAQLVGDLLERAFKGSAKKLVLQALSSKQASAEELAEIRQLLDDFERGKR
ncbi:MAG: BlaI/MecI/CopY family transcriptional regulator [Acidobacteriota bacterium]|nr:BlaI/MecI/CopY family transcriptional regulator [Acidobacteriota bacterium]